MGGLVKQQLTPGNVKGYDKNCCEGCNLTKPIRRPVPKTAERSGENTIQVNYMPVGHSEKGWKGEVGAYVYSLRRCKIDNAYTVRGAGTEEAAETLRSYIKDIVPCLDNKPTCIQTDARNQLVTRK